MSSANLRSRDQRLLTRILAGTSDANIRFDDLRRLLRALGFDERIRGSHHMFSKTGVYELINLQRLGSLAKDYQIKQVSSIFVKYGVWEW